MNAHNYKLSFANFATVAHKVNAAREPISVAEQLTTTINFVTFEKTSIYSNIDLIVSFYIGYTKRSIKKKRMHFAQMFVTF